MPSETLREKPNPKLIGSLQVAAIPQDTLCPIGCNECYFKPGLSYLDIPEDLPAMPDATKLSEHHIVRVNDGHDSNIDREKVIETTRHYKHKFYNTSLRKFDFPAPVVFTCNRYEDVKPDLVVPVDNLMFIRFRANTWNTHFLDDCIQWYCGKDTLVVVTFMRYHTQPSTYGSDKDYILKQHVKNNYWCITDAGKAYIMRQYMGNRLVTTCGMLEDVLCRDCRVCEGSYRLTWKRMRLSEELNRSRIE